MSFITSCVPVGGPYSSPYSSGESYAHSSREVAYDDDGGDYDDGPYDASPVYSETCYDGGPGYYYVSRPGYYTREPYYYRRGIPYDRRGAACRPREIVHHVVRSSHDRDRDVHHSYSSTVHHSAPSPVHSSSSGERYDARTRSSAQTYSPQHNNPSFVHHSPSEVERRAFAETHHAPPSSSIHHEEEDRSHHSSSSKKKKDDDDKKH